MFVMPPVKVALLLLEALGVLETLEVMGVIVVQGTNGVRYSSNWVERNLALLLLLALTIICVGIWCGHLVVTFHYGGVIDTNPFSTAIRVLLGQLPFGRLGGVVSILVIVFLSIVTACVGYFLSGRDKVEIDRVAYLMGKVNSKHRLSVKQVKQKNQELGLTQAPLLLGKAVTNNADICYTFEDVAVDLWGPRSGKTTARAVPLICEAPGVVIATSNKRDIVDITRQYRENVGKTWVFDPQNIAGEKPTWYWNPLAFVKNAVKARELAEIFASAVRQPGAKSDPHFDNAGQDLLAGLLLAAARGGHPLRSVWYWLQNPNNAEPVRILQAYGETATAALVAGIYDTHSRQRDGYIQTAKTFCTIMLNDEAMRWVEPNGRQEFNVQTFVQSYVNERVNQQTLYLLSKEGVGTAGPLITALAVAICQAGEEHAEHNPRGRLPVPMNVVLDEAANICRWSKLPDMYSHYGSRGIILTTILQNYAQGVVVWGKDGMKKMWAAATIRLVGAGVQDPEYLQGISQLIGDYWLRHSSSTYNGRLFAKTYSHQVAKEAILPVSKIASMPNSRILIFPSGSAPILGKTIPYWKRPYADKLPDLSKLAQMHK